jgi:hypothetical protein
MNAIRPYRPADRDALYAICIRTGDAGRDATALYRHPVSCPTSSPGPTYCSNQNSHLFSSTPKTGPPAI